MITITQQPITPNMVNADLLFEVSSSQIAQPQYQYVCDVYQSGSGTLIQRIKQQPNPSGYGVFNLRQILAYQEESDNVWKTQGYATSSLCNKDFIIKFGEEYGTSVSSSVTLYNGSGGAGAPAKTGSAFYTITNGLVEPNSGDWNFASSSYFTLETASVYDVFSYQHNLSYAPTTQSIQSGEYLTIALYNGNFDNTQTLAQDIYQTRFTWYDITGSVLQTDTLTNVSTNGGAPRTSTTQQWTGSGVYNGQTNKSRVIHIGVGVQNLDDDGITAPSGWAYYDVKVLAQQEDGTANPSGSWASLRFEKQEPQCIDNGVRFAWKNEFGVWDYFTFTLATAQTSNVERLEYEHTFVPYNTTTSTASYNVSRRGRTAFNNKIQQDKTANSDWLTQEQADWVRELFYSTDVFIQDGSNFLPAVITTANLVEKTNTRTQKNFQYQIQYRLANQPRSRF